MAEELINYKAIDAACVDICKIYKDTAPTVSRWADDLYSRMREDPRRVCLDEIITLQYIIKYVPDGNTVSNLIYKMYDRLGWDTTGMAGF